MNEYMLSVFAVSVTVGLASLISYSGKSDNASKFAFGVLILYSVASPLSELDLWTKDGFLLGNFDFDIEDFESDYETVAEEAFAEGIRGAICEKFALSDENVKIFIEDFDFSKMRAKKIRVVLSGSAGLADYKGIEKYINDMDIGECDAEIEIG